MAYIRTAYGVPAKRGGRVLYLYRNRTGTIIGSRSGHLRIRLDGDTHAGLYHPTWELHYFQAPAAQKVAAPGQEPQP